MAGRPWTKGDLLLLLAYASLVAYGIYLRLPGFDPPSFWNDDEWLAIAVRQMSWGDFLRLRPPVPIGFRLLQDLVGGVSSDPEWPLQIVPLLASVLQGLVAGFVAARLCNDRWVGLIAAAWALVSPAWTDLGVRPKQYATDGLMTVTVLLLALRMWQRPGPARVGAFLAGSVGALALAFPAVFAVAPAFAITLAMPSTRRVLLRRESRWPLLAALAAAAALLLFMKSQSGVSLHGYWSRRDAFMPTGSLSAAWSFLATLGWNGLTAGFPRGLSFLAIGAGAGVIVLSRDTLGRAALALILGIFVGLAASSALAQYPVQLGRLSAFHRPIGPILLAVGVYGCLRWLPGSSRSIAFVLAAAAALPFAERSVYATSQDAEAVRAVNERIRPTDTVITFLRSAHALAYYTPGTHEMVREPRLGCGFFARLTRPNTHYLWLGRAEMLNSYEELEAQLAPALAAATDRIIYVPPRFGRKEVRKRSSHIAFEIRDAGYRPSDREADRSPFLLVLERSPLPRNLVLVSLDTLRADRLSGYGYRRETSPNLDRYARDAVVFGRAVSASNETTASHHALFQSALPTRALPHAERAPTLATLLASRGWRTAAFTDGGPMSAVNGFARGFDLFDDSNHGLASSLPKARRWLDEAAAEGAPFYLFLHAFDIHSPYDPGPPWDTRFDPEYTGSVTGPGSKALLDSVRRMRGPAAPGKPPPVSPEDRRKLGALYDGGIARADALLADLLHRLDAPDLREDTVVVILSDHGEEFWDHGSVLHSHTLYQELLHVPLILRVPGWEDLAGRVDARVSLLDLVPTLLDILGQPVPPGLQGRSLVPLVREGIAASRAFESEGLSAGTYLQSVIQGRFKLIRRNHEPGQPVELYDLEHDPEERVDVSTQLPDVRDRLTRVLDRTRIPNRSSVTHPLDTPDRFDDGVRERLRELGYLE